MKIHTFHSHLPVARAPMRFAAVDVSHVADFSTSKDGSLLRFKAVPTDVQMAEVFRLTGRLYPLTIHVPAELASEIEPKLGAFKEKGVPIEMT